MKAEPGILPVVGRVALDHKSINYFVAGPRPQNRFVFGPNTALARCQWASFNGIFRIVSRICCHRGYYRGTFFGKGSWNRGARGERRERQRRMTWVTATERLNDEAKTGLSQTPTGCGRRCNPRLGRGCALRAPRAPQSKIFSKQTNHVTFDAALQVATT